MLIRLLYVSTATDGVDLNEFKQILLTAQTQNQIHDLTGMLAFNSKIFLQALEGDRDRVNQLYANLMRDKRHQRVTLLSQKEIAERHWSKWSMGFAAPNSDNRALFLKYSNRSIFNPYIMSSDAAEKLMIEMAATSISLNKPTNTTLTDKNDTPSAPASSAGSGIFAKFLKK